MRDPNTIAASLTKAQREAVLMLTAQMQFPNCAIVSSNAYKSLNDAWGGILVASEWRLNTSVGATHRKAYRLTRLGIAVRTILERNHR